MYTEVVSGPEMRIVPDLRHIAKNPTKMLKLFGKMAKLFDALTLQLSIQDTYLTVTPDPRQVQFRLPDHLAPKKYSLYLTPLLENGTVQGHVDVDIVVLKKGSKNLTLGSISQNFFVQPKKISINLHHL
jgi:hypothetical protein